MLRKWKRELGDISTKKNRSRLNHPDLGSRWLLSHFPGPATFIKGSADTQAAASLQASRTHIWVPTDKVQNYTHMYEAHGLLQAVAH